MHVICWTLLKLLFLMSCYVFLTQGYVSISRECLVTLHSRYCFTILFSLPIIRSVSLNFNLYLEKSHWRYCMGFGKNRHSYAKKNPLNILDVYLMTVEKLNVYRVKLNCMLLTQKPTFNCCQSMFVMKIELKGVSSSNWVFV